MKGDSQQSSFALNKETLEEFSDEMAFIRKYRDDITIKMNEFCCCEFGKKPKISENYIFSQPSSHEEVFRWTVRCDGSVFTLSLLKKELVCWECNSVFKEKHHVVPIDSISDDKTITDFIHRIERPGPAREECL